MGKLGCAGLVVLILIVLTFGGNALFGYYLENCYEDSDVIDCLLEASDEEEAEPEGAVTATGTYTFKSYEVAVTANIPLEGGAVTGTVSGTCDGKVRGSYDGKNNGGISGTMTGACSPFFVNIPASASFSGTVNKDAKTVPFGFTGQGAGFTHSGSMSLSY